MPAELTRLIPAQAVLKHAESTDAPTEYRLWLFQSPAGDWLNWPTDIKGLERHDLPGAVLDGLFASRLSRLDRGNLRQVPCRFTHWMEAGVEYQVREAVTDQGWFASFEQLPRLR